MITYIALVATLCVVLVNSQQGSQGPPPAVASAFKKLQTDVEGFIAAKTIDDAASQQTIIADIQAVFDAVKANVSNPPPAVTEHFTKFQTDIDAMKSAGKVDPAKISEIANGCSAMFSSQSMTQESVPGGAGAAAAGPGAAAGAGPAAGPKKGKQHPKLNTH